MFSSVVSSSVVSQSRIDTMGTVAAVLTWAAVGGAALAGVGIDADPLWWAAYTGYAVALACLVHDVRDYSRPVLALLLGVQLVLGIVIYITHPFGPTGVALVLTTCMLAVRLPFRAAVAGTVGQTLVAVLVGSVLHPADLGPLITMSVVYFGFQLFAFLMVLSNQREAAARLAAEQAQAALYRAQAELAARSRDEERLRIARDLHDTLGHQLTALTLNLEVLAHTADEASAAQARTCRALAKDVLARVRAVVSQLREARPDDLGARLADLVPALPRPRLELDVDPDLGPVDAAGVDAVTRLVQEALTNSARHSDATVLSVRVRPSPEGISVQVRDDGSGGGPVVPGNGLRGMAERFTALGGTARWSRTEGFTIHADLPARLPAGAR